MKPHEPYDEVPSLGLSLHDIRAITTIVASYLMFVRREKPSRQRDAEMTLLEGLHKRILATMPTEGGVVPLTTQELRALANAMQGFANVTRQIIPASAEREEVLKTIMAIRQHLLRMLAGSNN